MSGGGKQMRKFSGFAFALRRCMWKEKKSGLIVKGMWGMGGWKNFDGLYKPIQSAHTYYWYFYKKRINIFFETYGILWESFTGRRAIRICSAWRPLLFTPSSSGRCNRASLLGGTLPGYHVLFLLWLYPSMVVCAGLSMPLRAGVTCEGLLLSK